VFNEFINQNKFVIETETHIKFIEYNKKKTKYYVRLHILKILWKNQYCFWKKNKFNIYKI